MTTTTPKNALKFYQATNVNSNATGVRITLYRPGPVGVEVIGYLGTAQALAAAGVVPPSMFEGIGASGARTGRFMHPDGSLERVYLWRRARGLWLAQRAHRIP